MSSRARRAPSSPSAFFFTTAAGAAFVSASSTPTSSSRTVSSDSGSSAARSKCGAGHGSSDLNSSRMPRITTLRSSNLSASSLFSFCSFTNRALNCACSSRATCAATRAWKRFCDGVTTDVGGYICVPTSSKFSTASATTSPSSSPYSPSRTESLAAWADSKGFKTPWFKIQSTSAGTAASTAASTGQTTQALPPREMSRSSSLRRSRTLRSCPSTLADRFTSGKLATHGRSRLRAWISVACTSMLAQQSCRIFSAHASRTASSASSFEIASFARSTLASKMRSLPATSNTNSSLSSFSSAGALSFFASSSPRRLRRSETMLERTDFCAWISSEFVAAAFKAKASENVGAPTTTGRAVACRARSTKA
mmetsp:Transcript_2746/g.8042  ORF Transcript_2746/g.8042 Transcript_2746/m.8042 type:complete len:367 (+) Transcript_2746:1469-2569(+)